MRIAVASHATIDHIVRSMRKGLGRDCYDYSITSSPSSEVMEDEEEVITVGGPVCYAGLMVSRLGNNIIPVTRVGSDFRGYADMLSSRYGMNIPSQAFCDLPTTKFRLVIKEYDSRQRRSLYLLARCADITLDILDQEGFDACIASPVMDEISIDTIMALAKRSNFTFLDPQGLLRRVDGVDGHISLKGRDLDLDLNLNLNKLMVDVMKVDLDEAYALTGVYGLDSLDRVGKYSKTAAVLSMDNRVFMYSKDRDRVYELTTDIVSSRDSTGAGDIFAGAYTSAYMSSRDAVWALAYGVAAACIALSSGRIGLDKIPSKRDVEDHAYILLERVKH
ncbi:MAG: PfkB family carbohydrate kinase [Candidatus Nitrosocaldus sp.]